MTEPTGLPQHPGARYDPLEVARQLSATLAKLEQRPAMEVSHVRGDPPDVWRFSSTALIAGWTVSGSVARRRDAMVVRELSFVPTSDEFELKQATLRQLRLQDIADHVRERVLVAEQAQRIKEQAGFSSSKPLRAAADSVRSATQTQRGRPGLSDAYLWQLAEAYLAEADGGRGVYVRVAARLGMDSGEQDTATTLRNHLFIARKRGWLTTLKPGAAGAAPGPSLIAARKDGDDGKR